MAATEPEKSRGLRTGYTTGACAPAAAKAAARLLIQGVPLSAIVTTLPNDARVSFALHRREKRSDSALASVIKDAGDDPDWAHGAEIVAEVALTLLPGIEIRGG